MSALTGLFGGTFDPPHLGHVAALEAAWATGWYGRIEVTVAGDPYEKSDRTVTSAEARFAMAHAAFDGLRGVTVSDREIRRRGPTYTIDTVRELAAGGETVELILGADAAVAIDRWRESDELATRASLAVVPRTGVTVSLGPRWRVRSVPMAEVDLSSTWLRECTTEEALSYLPAKVVPLFVGRAG